MASVPASNDTYTFFKKLKCAVVKISHDVKDVETALQVSKYELPENYALLTIIKTKDDIELLKNEAGNIAEEIIESNRHYSQHIQDVEGLVAEMEEKIGRIENYMESYNFKKAEDLTVVNEKNKDNAVVNEKIKNQNTRIDSAAAEHCEITNNESENSGKENRIKEAVQKTPQLKNLGVIFQKQKCLSRETKCDISSLKYSISGKFLSNHPLSMLSHRLNNKIYDKLHSRNCSVSPTPYIDKMEITPGLYRKKILATANEPENSFQYTNSTRTDDTETPEEPIILCSTQKLTMAQDKSDTPEEPASLHSTRKVTMIQDISDTPEEPIRLCNNQKITITQDKSDTPEEPASLHSARKVTMIQSFQENTPEPPELTSSFKLLMLH